MARKHEFRMMPPEYKTGGLVRFMAEADRYVMVRRPRCVPFVVASVDWRSWPVVSPTTDREG